MLLTRPRRTASRRGDRGAVAAIAAVFFGTGVALAIAALVVDIGLIYAEHKQLQTGADAAAVAVAQICATSAVECGAPESDAAAVQYARDNARGGEATATTCGRGGALAECPPGGPDVCATPAPDAGVYAEVRTSILKPDGSTLLPPVFAQAVVDDYDGTAVTACARATWGAPTAARTLGLAISTCDWERMTAGGATFPTTEQAIPLYDEADPTACGQAGAGSGPGDPGGFRWQTGADDACLRTTSTTAAFQVTLPAETPDGCLAALESLIAAPGAVAVPIFATATNVGGGFDYTARGVAAFVVTGWQLPAASMPSPTLSDCGAGVTTCVFGFFTRAVVPGGGTVGGPDLGAQITALIG